MYWAVLQHHLWNSSIFAASWLASAHLKQTFLDGHNSMEVWLASIAGCIVGASVITSVITRTSEIGGCLASRPAGPEIMKPVKL